MWSRRDHRKNWDSLSAYLDDEITPRETARLERHLASCAACQQELATLRQTRLVLRSLPLQPVPRSFVLPLGVAHTLRPNIWENSFSFLRGAAVALTLLLALMLSGNALLTTGRFSFEAAPSSEQALPPTAARAEPVAAAPEAPVEQPQPAPEMALPTATPLARLAATARQPVEEAPARAMAADKQAADEAPLAAEQPAGAEQPASKASPADQQGPLTALAAAPHPPTLTNQPQPEAFAGAGGGVDGLGGAPAPSDRDEPALNAMAPEPTPMMAPAATLLPTTTTPPQPTLTAEAPTLAAPTPTPAPTMAVVAAALPTEAAPVEPAPPRDVKAALEPAPRANVATLQQMLRISSSVLAGLLLMVAGGLLWTGYKRRV